MRPTKFRMKELETRYDYARPEDFDGVDETCRIDRDAALAVRGVEGRRGSGGAGIWTLLRNEGGRVSRRMPDRAVAFRRGAAWVSVVPGEGGRRAAGSYSVFGYKGKQVRDNIHSYDVVRAIEEFAANPRPGEVYNLGGGRANSISMLEAIAKIEELTGRKLNWRYVDEARKGDHICYISNMGKFKSHYPNWRITRGIDSILEEMTASHRDERASPAGR